MPQFDIENETINVFEIDDEYLFKHYFDRTDVFEFLSEYYNGETYRFEVPKDDFESVKDRLADEYVELSVVDDLEAFCVVKEQYTEHAEILKQSVEHWERRSHLFFIMKDDLAVREAVERGGQRLEETEFVLGL